MKKESHCLLALFSFLFVFHLNAQKIALGVKGGLNLSSFGGSYVKGLDTKSKLGYNFGITADYSFSENFYVTSGLEYSYKGDKASFQIMFDEGNSYNQDMKYNAGYLQIPIHIGYKEAVSSAVNISIYAGPYIAYGIEGKIKYLTVSEEEETVTNPNFFGRLARRFDSGMGAGVGMEIKTHYMLQLGYDLGLLNICKINGLSIKNRNFYISAGYKF